MFALLHFFFSRRTMYDLYRITNSITYRFTYTSGRRPPLSPVVGRGNMYCRSHFTRSLRDLRSCSIARTKTWSSLPPVQSFTSPNAMDDGTRLLGGTDHDFRSGGGSSTIHRGYYTHFALAKHERGRRAFVGVRARIWALCDARPGLELHEMLIS